MINHTDYTVLCIPVDNRDNKQHTYIINVDMDMDINVFGYYAEN